MSLSKDQSQEPQVLVNDTDYVRLDTSAIRKQLGAVLNASHLSIEDRGIVPFNSKTIDHQSSALVTDYDGEEQYLNTTTYAFMYQNVWAPIEYDLQLLINSSLDVSTSGPVDLNTVISDIFLTTLDETQNPTLALQAMWTTVLRSAYYDEVPFFDHSQEISTRVVSNEQMLVGNKGLIAVVVLIVTHWILTMTVVALFVRKGKYGVLNKAWAAVLEVWTLQTQALLGNGATRTRLCMEDDVGVAEPLLERIVRLREVETHSIEEA